MGTCVQELFYQEDCSDFMVKMRQQAVKQALLRYKHGNSTPEEKETLIQAMRLYRGAAKEENKARAYNELLCFYFAEKPLDSTQMPVRFQINRRTVFKDINRGIKDLTVILYGIGGIPLLSDDESSAALKERLQASIYKQLSNLYEGREAE